VIHINEDVIRRRLQHIQHRLAASAIALLDSDPEEFISTCLLLHDWFHGRLREYSPQSAEVRAKTFNRMVEFCQAMFSLPGLPDHPRLSRFTSRKMTKEHILATLVCMDYRVHMLNYEEVYFDCGLTNDTYLVYATETACQAMEGERYFYRELPLGANALPTWARRLAMDAQELDIKRMEEKVSDAFRPYKNRSMHFWRRYYIANTRMDCVSMLIAMARKGWEIGHLPNSTRSIDCRCRPPLNDLDLLVGEGVITQ